MGRKIKRYIMIMLLVVMTGTSLKMGAHLGEATEVFAKSTSAKKNNTGKTQNRQQKTADQAQAEGKKRTIKDIENKKAKQKNVEKKNKKIRIMGREEIDEKEETNAGDAVDKKENGSGEEPEDKKKEGETEKEKDNEKKEDETEKEKDDEKNDREDIEETDKNQDQEENEEADEEENEEDDNDFTFVSNEIIKQVEEVELYQISYNEPDGKNGYYIKKPQVSLKHISPNGITKYRTVNGVGDKQEGILDKAGTECSVSDRFMEGKNILEVWMEDANGQVIGESESRQEFDMDMLNPKVKISVPQGFRAWYPEDVPLSVEADDGARGSQIAEIQCKIGDKLVGRTENSTAQFQITEEANSGQGVLVHVIVTDHAGNRTELADRVCLDKKLPVTTIEGIQDYLITSKPVNVIYRAKEENRMKELQAGTSHEDEKGNTTQQNITKWEENGKEKSGSQTLSKNGIYKLQVLAEDMAGNQSKTEKQVIIDKDNPVIMHVEELDGKYMKEFQWQYESGEWIQDFTSYTYLMQLDDELYKPGEKIEKEGTHTLRVSAEDAAGNTGEAKAKFVIDHTPPVIRFENVAEGETYEKERTVKIQTEKKEDYIEAVKINGKEQKLKKKNTDSYECKLDEEKEYEIEVRAKDLAQNETVSRVSFRIGAEKSILQKIIDPVKRTFFGGKDGDKDVSKGDINDEKETEGGYLLWKITGALVIGSTVCIIGYRKKEYLKNLMKKFRK